MVHCFARILRGGPNGPAILLLCVTAAVVRADGQLQIASPENGATVPAGSEVTVTASAPPGQFQSVSIVGDGPFSLSTSVSVPPYRYSYPIPATMPSGRYRFKAVGLTAAGATVDSEPVEVLVEQTERPVKLQSEWQSRQIAYTSDRPGVAAVSNEGAVTGAKAGKAKVTIKYGDRLLVLPVVVGAR